MLVKLSRHICFKGKRRNKEDNNKNDDFCSQTVVFST